MAMTQSIYKYRDWLHIADKYSYKYSMHLQEIQMLNHIQLWHLDVCTDKQRQDYQSCRITPRSGNNLIYGILRAKYLTGFSL